MINSSDALTRLYIRDLDRLAQEIDMIPEDALWDTLPGISNSCGVLTQHIVGNLQHFIGEALGKTGYQRERDLEFTNTGISGDELRTRVGETQKIVKQVMSSLSESDSKAPYPSAFPFEGMTLEVLVHLYGHFNYHLGQINYLRRILTEKG